MMGIAEKFLMECHALKQYNLPIKSPGIYFLYAVMLGIAVVFVCSLLVNLDISR